MEYGIAVTNKFGMFFDDECDDPLEILQRNEEEAAKQKKLEKENPSKSKTSKSKGKTSTTVSTGKPVAKSAAKSDVQNRPSSVSDGKGKASSHEFTKKDNSDKPQSSSKQNDNVNRIRASPATDESLNRLSLKDNAGHGTEFRERAGAAMDSTGEFGFRGRGGFRRGGRGGHGGFGSGNTTGGFDRFGKREFDRHSGSDRGGVRAVDKRDGGGAHNWGNIKDDIEAEKSVELTGEVTERLESDVNEGTAVVEGESGNIEEKNRQLAEEEKQMTLDEWKRSEKEKKLKATFNIRQPGEGCADPKWKKMYQLKKKVDDEEYEEEEEDDEDDTQDKKKNVVPIAITFNDTGRYGGGMNRGGRGAPRGGRGSFAGRGGGSRGTGFSGKPVTVEAPNVDNEADFPSLG